jgi:hypothetical protein
MDSLNLIAKIQLSYHREYASRTHNMIEKKNIKCIKMYNFKTPGFNDYNALQMRSYGFCLIRTISERSSLNLEH